VAQRDAVAQDGEPRQRAARHPEYAGEFAAQGGSHPFVGNERGRDGDPEQENGRICKHPDKTGKERRGMMETFFQTFLQAFHGLRIHSEFFSPQELHTQIQHQNETDQFQAGTQPF